MKRKNLLYVSLGFLSLLLLSFWIINIKEVKSEETFINGDLRCKDEDKASGKCEEKLSGGKIVETRITEKFDGTYSVTKIVRKKDGSADRFLVSFIVNGPNSTEYQESRDANIVVLFDKSGSLTKNSNAYKNSRDAVVEFSKKFKEQKLSLIVFAGSIKKFTSVPFDGGKIKDASVGSSSHIEKAFKEANEIFDKAKAEDNKYLIVFGDGQYWYKDNTCRESNQCAEGKSSSSCSTTFEKELNKLKKRENIIFYTILYKSTSSERIKCDYEWIKKIADGENFHDARDNNNYQEFFDKIADSIETHQESTSITITASVKDEIGHDFNLTDGSNSIKVKKLGTETAPFEIQLSESAKTESENLWHDTNEGYKVTIKISDGTKKDFSSNLSPKVYWKPESEEVPSCSSNINKSKTESNLEKYFYEECLEYITGNIKVNNLDLGIKSFSVKSGLGFPANINLFDNVKCTYTFKEEEFKNDYKKLLQDMKSTDAKVVAEATVMLQEMNGKLNTFKDLTSGSNLKSFKDNEFSSQTATMKIKYYDTSSSIDVDFATMLSSGDVTCTSIKNINLSDLSGVSQSNVNNTVCNFEGKKNFELPKVCINMKTYKQEKCDSTSDTQLLGESKYYVDFDKKGGYVSISVPAFGYFKTDIYLDGTKKNAEGKYNCIFDITPLPDIIFRQINVADPFVQNINGVTKRVVGRNFLNSKYDFVNIIDKDIWDDDKLANYFYQLSKTNVENIKKDTLDGSSKAQSYLGTDCYIDKEVSKNKYICSFTRNIKVDSNFFTKAEFND